MYVVLMIIISYVRSTPVNIRHYMGKYMYTSDTPKFQFWPIQNSKTSPDTHLSMLHSMKLVTSMLWVGTENIKYVFELWQT